MNDWAMYLPDVSIVRGGLHYPKFMLEANALPVAIKDSHGLMLRLVSHYGYQGKFECEHLDVHDQDGLLTMRVRGTLRGSRNVQHLELLHLESRHETTGSVAQIAQTMIATRRTIKGRERTGLGTFRLEMFRPQAV
jgi:hypothetical protein